jgi:hypothetical protein
VEGFVETSDRVALGDEYNQHEGTIANYFLMVAIPWGAMRRAGIDPANPRGDLLTGLWIAAVFGYGGWFSPRNFRKLTTQLISLANACAHAPTRVHGHHARLLRRLTEPAGRLCVPNHVRQEATYDPRSPSAPIWGGNA